jgi:DNA-binding IclR family transcriptional regulator
VATGKVLLAHQGADEIERRVKQAEVFTPRTITRRDDLLTELESVRNRGYAVNVGEWRENVGGIAVPVHGRSGALIAALGFSGPHERILARKSELLEGIRNAAAEIGRET